MSSSPLPPSLHPLVDKARAVARLMRRKGRSAGAQAGKTAQAGIDLMEAASVNRDHPLLPSSRPEHLRAIFSTAAGLLAAGVIIPTVTTGVVAGVGMTLLSASKMVAYRGFRVMWPYDPNHSTRFADNPVRAAVDLFEATSLNLPHPLIGQATPKNLPKLFGGAAAGLGVGLTLGIGSVGLPAAVGVATYMAGSFAAFRAYRVIFPYKGGPK